MHDRMRMIQRRAVRRPSGDRRERSWAKFIPALFAGIGTGLLHRPHGPGIATSSIASHVTEEGPIEQRRRERYFLGRTRMTADKAQDILNSGGVTLLALPGRRSAARWIDPGSKAFHEDESPQMKSYARDLAPLLSLAELHYPVRFRPGVRPLSTARTRCALVTQAFTSEFDNAVF